MSKEVTNLKSLLLQNHLIIKYSENLDLKWGIFFVNCTNFLEYFQQNVLYSPVAIDILNFVTQFWKTR